MRSLHFWSPLILWNRRPQLGMNSRERRSCHRLPSHETPTVYLVTKPRDLRIVTKLPGRKGHPMLTGHDTDAAWYWLTPDFMTSALICSQAPVSCQSTACQASETSSAQFTTDTGDGTDVAELVTYVRLRGGISYRRDNRLTATFWL
jgi:hypothetical protein